MTAKVLIVVEDGIPIYASRGDVEVRCLDFDTESESEEELTDRGVIVGTDVALPGIYTDDNLSDKDFLDQWELAGVE